MKNARRDDTLCLQLPQVQSQARVVLALTLTLTDLQEGIDDEWTDGRATDLTKVGLGGRQNALFNVIDVFVSFTFWHLHANPLIRARTSAASPAAGQRSVGRGGGEASL